MGIPAYGIGSDVPADDSAPACGTRVFGDDGGLPCRSNLTVSLVPLTRINYSAQLRRILSA
jgi:hypothetical protein